MGRSTACAEGQALAQSGPRLGLPFMSASHPSPPTRAPTAMSGCDEENAASGRPDAKSPSSDIRRGGRLEQIMRDVHQTVGRTVTRRRRL